MRGLRVSNEASELRRRVTELEGVRRRLLAERLPDAMVATRARARSRRSFPGARTRSTPTSPLELWPDGTAPSLLYAREPQRMDPWLATGSSQETGRGLVRTQLAKVSSRAGDEDLVYCDSSFDVRVVGVSHGCVEDMASRLTRLGLRREDNPGRKLRVLYSTRKEGEEGCGAVIPTVHHDFRREPARGPGGNSARYVAVPAERSLVTRGGGGCRVVSDRESVV